VDVNKIAVVEMIFTIEEKHYIKWLSMSKKNLKQSTYTPDAG